MKNNDNRRNKRYVVEGIYGNVLYTSDLEVLNISLDGAAIETPRRLELNREYTFKIRYKNSFLNIRGRVVWAILVSKERKDTGTVVPLYRAGIRFTDVLSEKAGMLRNFIEDNKIKTVENRLGGDRFKISAYEKIKVDLPHKYKVKMISLSGMLVETEYSLDIDSRYDVELFIDGALMSIIGRIANCREISESDVIKYDIGIEFVAMSDNDKVLLQNFLNKLEDT